jgi:hypothetical protein
MKKIIFTVAAVLALGFSSFGQAPEGFKYQAVVRDPGNTILNNQAVGVQLTILQAGTAVYTETHSAVTNGYGLMNLEIGAGVSTDDFTIIDWANGPFFIETAIDVTGGTTYNVMGTSQMMSVPYALYAKTSGSSIPGPAGPQGPAGTNGIDGIDGAVGPAGTNGVDGIDGVDGAVGPAGTNGIDGVDGQGGVSTAGTNVTVTGLGTVGSPYVINATDNVDDADADPTNELELPTSASAGDMSYWDGTSWVVIAATPNEGAALQMIGGVPTWIGGVPPIPTITIGANVWLDKNLGATNTAIVNGSTDATTFGDLYQWGRETDGHQIRTSSTTSAPSSTDSPGHGLFINIYSNWRSPGNDNLWQGLTGINNPCPSGYRVPTIFELADLNDPSFLYPLGGNRQWHGGFSGVNSGTYYWSSNVSSSSALAQSWSGFTVVQAYARATGCSIRCIQD